MNNKINNITQKEFDRVKELLFEGTPEKEIAEIVGRAQKTVNWLKFASSLENYYEIKRAYSRGLNQRRFEQQEKAKATLLALKNKYLRKQKTWQLRIPMQYKYLLLTMSEETGKSMQRLLREALDSYDPQPLTKEEKIEQYKKVLDKH